MMVIRSKAPLRISFAGGGTDVPPFSDEFGGAVLSSTINMYAYCTIAPRSDTIMRIRSLDLNRDEIWKANNGMLKYDGNMDLLKAVINHFEIKNGFDMFLRCDAPPGSGLGGSSTVMVSIIGAVAEWMDEAMTQYDIAKLAHKLEREELKFSGGKQDQYATVFGGFNFMEFSKDDTVVMPLRISDDVLNELQYHSLLCYTGVTRSSAKIIDEQTKNVKECNTSVIEAFTEAKKIAYRSRDALMKGDIREMGYLMFDSWLEKKKFAEGITNTKIDDIYDTAIKFGALGGKISGAGGGGYMFFICREDTNVVADALRNMNVQIQPFSFEEHGLQTWRYRV